MKTKLLLLVMLVAMFSCEKSNDENENNVDEEQIRSEVQAVANDIFKGIEEVNAGLIMEQSYNSPGFVYLFNGTTLTYQEFSQALADFYVDLASQEVTLLSEKFAVLDNSTVLYTANCTFLQNFSIGDPVLIDPVVMMFVFKKIDGNWKWIYGVESYG